MGADANPFPEPSVVVYPLTGTGQTPSEAGGNIALLLATKLSALGGLAVKPSTPGTERAQFLSAAQASGVDYYITGYLTPVGTDVSLIIQVVSVASGSIVYSNTSTVRTYADVVAQADPLREAILTHAGRGFPAVQSVTTPATPPPIASGGALNLTKALEHHTRDAGPSLPWGLVVQVDGDGTSDAKSFAQNALVKSLHATGLQGELFPVSSADAQHNAAALCKANPATVALFLPTLTTSGSGVSLAVNAIGCDGSPIGTQTSMQSTTERGGLDAAIARAADAAALALAPAVKPLTAPKTTNP